MKVGSLMGRSVHTSIIFRIVMSFSYIRGKIEQEIRQTRERRKKLEPNQIYKIQHWWMGRAY